MGNLNRICLQAGQSLALSEYPDGRLPKGYRILSVIGEGGSTVCYEAVRECDGKTGKLKEFYPIDAAAGSRHWYYSLERLDNGQLVPNGGTIRKFDEMCGDYLKAYTLLNKVIADNPRNEVLKNYIQNSEVLYGCVNGDQAGGGISARAQGEPAGNAAGGHSRATVYVWSAGIMGQGFDRYLAQVRAEPGKRSDYRLHDILQTVIALTDCIKALHTAGLMHLDIKPSNFLIPYDSDNGINTASISMFDINTLYYINSNLPMIAGTDGYRAPEVLRGKADNRSDIYSIGAMLFHAVVVSKDIPDGLYKDSYYNDIDQLVRHSELIAGSESNSDVYLMARLANILKKCLARDPENRYEGCGRLLEDLRKAEIRSKQYAVSANLIGHNKKLAIIDANEKGINDPAIVIQKLLHEHPLYETLRGDARTIHVLVVGSGTYGQKFIDLCLQAGQMKGFSLRVTAISNTPDEDRGNYLRFRPAAGRFVNVDGSMDRDTARAYGTLRFAPILDTDAGYDGGIPEFRRGTSAGAAAENRALVSAVVASAVENDQAYNYIFVALGNDRLNYSIAKLFAEITADRGDGTNCPVCYISERVKKAGGKSLGIRLYPVCVNEKITPDVIDPRLEQMAFNTHISWNSSLNLDISQELEAFRRDKYNYSSSLAFALSVRYKLFSIGIDTADCLEAAEVFAKEILERKNTDPEAKRKFDALVALEHRRWVLSLITDGWTAPLDKSGKLKLEECVIGGKVKNASKRTHPCIVFSTEATPLHSAEYSAGGRRKWDDPNIDPNLDELDRMSVELHQCFQRHADEFIKTNPLQGEDMKAIWELVSGSGEEAIRAYKQFQFCLKNILNGVESYTRQYGYYEQLFKDALLNAGEGTRSKVSDRLRLVSKAFFPVVEANLHRNYKANDEILIEKIPFILSYRFQPCIAMAFEDGKFQNGRNEAVFANVAAATVLSPQRIRFLYYYSRGSKTDLLIRKISAVVNYLGKRRVHCAVTMAVACQNDVADRQRGDLQKSLERLKKTAGTGLNTVFEDYEIYDCADSGEAAEVLLRYLKDVKPDLYDGTTSLFHSALGTGLFADGVLKRGIPYFEFDWKNKTFTRHKGCDYLQYIRDNSCIRVNDMFSLMNAADSKFNLPEFAEDYETLWGIYTGSYLPSNKFEHGVWSWNRLCKALEKHEKGQKPLAEITLEGGRPTAKKTMVYLMPAYTYKTVKYILSKLIEYGAVDSGSEVAGYTSENCKVQVTADPSLEKVFNDLFYQPSLLMEYYGIEVTKRPDYNADSVIIKCNQLTVTDANIDPEGKGRCKSIFDVLRELEKARFITQLKQNPGNPGLVSFVYSSPRIKKLLTSAGEILEVYTYYQVLKTGYFDDVACGYEFNWEYGGVKNELDLVLTKGFRSIIVECKAVQKLEHKYYHKLHSIAEHFGIAAIKVLVGNIYRQKDQTTKDANTMQRTRGNQLNIITISNERKIKNIGNTLMELMDRQ